MAPDAGDHRPVSLALVLVISNQFLWHLVLVIRYKFLCRKDPPGGSTGGNRFEIRQPALFDGHDSQVWRVSWNVIGTILVSSGADGCVRMWKGGVCHCSASSCAPCTKVRGCMLQSLCLSVLPAAYLSVLVVCPGLFICHVG